MTETSENERMTCTLCTGQHRHFSTPASWKNEDACALAQQLNLSEGDPVCVACRKDITRVLNDRTHIPRWAKAKKRTTCCIAQCSNSVFASLHKVSSDDLVSTLESAGLSSTTVEVPVPLCKHHYHVLYNMIQPTQTHCKTCGMSLRNVTVKSCPDPDKVQKYLQESIGYEEHIDHNDKVCYTCYRAQLVILRTEESVSYDTDLENLIATLSAQVCTKVTSVGGAIENAMKRISVYVGRQLLEGKALVLPVVHGLLCQYIDEELHANNLEAENVPKLLTSRWVLSSLRATLQKHIAYNCTVRKYGTLIYRPQTDLRPVLAEALWRIHNMSTHVPQESPEVKTVRTDIEVLEELNTHLHCQIKTLLARDAVAPIDHDNLDVEELIADMDPKLWEAITLLTQSLSERRGTCKADKENSTAYHIKRVRRLFLLCNLMFITDDRCSIPLHILLADLVESQGGSALLHRILNRVGVCASSDTLSRFMQHKAKAVSGKPEVFPNMESFTIVSADNVDLIHKHARVVRGNTNSSWHGTTVQAVQPMPSLSLVSHSSPVPPTAMEHMQPASSLQPVSVIIPEDQDIQASSLLAGKSRNPSPPTHESLGHTESEEQAATGSFRMSSMPTPDPPIEFPEQAATFPVREFTTSLIPVPSPPTMTLQFHEQAAILPQEEFHRPREESRKRRERSSPVHSPLKETVSPTPKQRRRLRTGTEKSTATTNILSHDLIKPSATKTLTCSLQNGGLSDFKSGPGDTLTIAEIQEELNTYMTIKSSVYNMRPQFTFLSMQQYFAITRANHTEKSNVLFLEVMDAIADTKDTMIAMLQNLHQKFIEGQGLEHLLVTGDAKLYNILQALKHEYGEELHWLMPYPGDWHILKNYQVALLKPYYNAGLKDMAKAAGYPLPQIQSCSQFKRVHYFLLESWEALYRAMLSKFLAYCDTRCASEEPLMSAHTDDMQHTCTSTVTTQPMNASEKLQELIVRMLENMCSEPGNKFHDTFKQNISAITRLVTRNEVKEFHKFLKMMAEQDDTWRFWVQFVLEDGMAYVGLFLALRSGDWKLRMACLKLMAPLFTAFDHSNYQKLISQHLADVLSMPPAIITAFQQGAFVVSISGSSWHSVAIDEAHEMLINKGCKTSVTRPTPDYINRIAQYLPYRTRALQNTQKQLFPETKLEEHTTLSPFTSDSNAIKFEQNVVAMTSIIEKRALFTITEENRGLINPFCGKLANPQQSRDLLQFRAIGQQEFLNRVAYFVLKQPSVPAPNRRCRLLTFSEIQRKSKRISQLEKDNQLILTAMKKKIQHSNKTGTLIHRPGEQLVQLPLAICDHDGNQLKGQKSYTTNSIQRRYKTSSPPVFTNNLPIGWTPQCVLIDGMFLINTSPLGSHKTLADYAIFLLRRHAILQFNRGSEEVHIIFDNPGQLANTPKCFEQERRDKTKKMLTDHYCDVLNGETKILQGKWQESLLNCRVCKRKLVNYVGNFFLDRAGTYLETGQTLYVAGCFEGETVNTAWFVHEDKRPQPHPAFTCNAEEADTRIWLHVTNTVHRRLLIVSPDTDVYHIGLPLPCVTEKEIIIQVSPLHCCQLKLLNITSLVLALGNDPDLAQIDSNILPKVFQTLYAVSGCDYISFFSQLGKATFLRYFYQYASFISSGHDLSGTLADTCLQNGVYEQGYLAFLRLIGTVYFKTHSTAFDISSPDSYFQRFCQPNQTALQQHSAWLDDIRESMWYRIKFENEMIPSDEALLLHWKRTCWILDMWAQANSNNMALEPMTEYGWTLQENVLSVTWDSEENMRTVKDRVSALLQGCKCVTGCSTARCGCQKKKRECSVGCECTNCTNIVQGTDDEQIDHMHPEMLSNDELDESIDWVFGREGSDMETEENVETESSD